MTAFTPGLRWATASLGRSMRRNFDCRLPCKLELAITGRFFASAGDSRRTGSVKRWNEERGFGFLLSAEGGDDVFFHRTALGDVPSPELGQAVSYDYVINDRTGKASAAAITLLADGAPNSSMASTSHVESPRQVLESPAVETEQLKLLQEIQTSLRDQAARVSSLERTVAAAIARMESGSASLSASASASHSSHRSDTTEALPAQAGSGENDEDGAKGSDSWKASAFHMVGSMSGWTINSNPIGPSGGRIVIRRNALRAPDTSQQGDIRREEFQLVGDGSWDKRVYPASCREGEAVLLEPGRPSAVERGNESSGHGRNWALNGEARAAFRIIYDAKTGTIRCTAE